MLEIELQYILKKDEINKKLYKSLIAIFKEDGIETQINNIFIIKPLDDFKKYKNNTQNTFLNNYYDLSFNNLSRIEIDDFNSSIQLKPGKWIFGINKENLDSNDLISTLTTKEIFIPYRDFLYNNDKPIFIRDDVNLNKLFYIIDKNELLKYRDNNKKYLFDIGKISESDIGSKLKTFFEIVSWFPNNEKTSDPDNQNAWELPSDYTGTSELRINSAPVFYESNENIVLYKNLSSFNEPGFRYDNKSYSQKTFFINRIATLVEFNSSNQAIRYYKNFSEQYYRVQDISLNVRTNQDFNNEITNVRKKLQFIDINQNSSNSNYLNIDINNWEAEIYIPEQHLLDNDLTGDIIGEPKGFFSYGIKRLDNEPSLVLGIRGIGTYKVQDISGAKKSFIFRDISGTTYHAELFRYGVVQETQGVYRGGFRILYKFRKNKKNLFDVFIFINNNFVLKVEDKGCKLNDINYWGNHEKLNSTDINGTDNDKSLQCYTRVYQSIENKGNIEDIYENKNTITWNKYIPVFNNYLTEKEFFYVENDGVVNETIYGSNDSETYPVYFTDNSGITGNYGESYEKTVIFDMKQTNGVDNNIYIEIEDFNFNYSIEDVTCDKLSLYVSDVQTGQWIKPGSLDLSGVEWFYKDITRNTIKDISLNRNQISYYGTNTSETFPVNFYDDGDNLHYSNDISGEVIFDTSTNKLKYIVLKPENLDISFNHLSIFGLDKLSIEYSDDLNENYIEPEISWMYKNSLDISENENTPLIKLDVNTSGNIYGNNIVHEFPVIFTDSGGVDGNFSPNENYYHIFDSSGDNISVKIEDLSIFNSQNIFQVFGTNNLVDVGIDTSQNWIPLQIKFMKNKKNYSDQTATFYGNYFPYDKRLITTSNEDVVFNTNYRYIIFYFNSNQNVKSGWKLLLYKLSKHLLTNGNYFPNNITSKKIIETNKRYIRFRFDSDFSINRSGWKIDLYIKDDYENQNFGYTLPENIEKAKQIFERDNFFEFNKITFPYRYLKFVFKSDNDGFTSSGWKIRIDNKQKELYNQVFDPENSSGKYFIEKLDKQNYPVLFSSVISTYDFISNTVYNYTFDAGINNNLVLDFIDFNFLQNGITGSNDGNILLNNRFAISYSSDGITWTPLTIPWMYKTQNFIGNSTGTQKLFFYDDYYTSFGTLINQNFNVSWYDSTNGFILPENKEKALEIYTYYLNKNGGTVYKNLSWEKLRKVYVNARFIRFNFTFQNVGVSSQQFWNIGIYKNEDIGTDMGITSNFNNLNINTKNTQVNNLSFEPSISELGITTILDSVNFSKNNSQVPYISKYDYEIKDFSNNIVLKSQIDTDLLYTQNSNNFNYSSKRTGKEYIELENINFSSIGDVYNILQKYNYNVSFLDSNIGQSLPYIPGSLQLKFNNTNNRVKITIPLQQINELKENLITYWQGGNYATYIDLILFIWYPWSFKYTKYNTNNTEVNNDLRYLLTEENCDELLRISIDSKKFFTINQVGLPSTNSFDYIIREFSGRYLFAWSYTVYQPSGLYNNITPSQLIYNIDNDNAYTPSVSILDIKDFVKDDFIYDPQAPIMTYIQKDDISNDYNKITISLSETEIENFNTFMIKHRRSLTSQNCDINSLKIKFYIWTPNNEKSYLSSGWELPSDYFGLSDPRTSITPFYFTNKPVNVDTEIWDPYFVINNKIEFGYNIESSGIIKKEYQITKNNNGDLLLGANYQNDIVFDISYGNIVYNINDQYNSEYILNNDIPNPFNYIKNGFFGIPYLSRWEFELVEDLTNIDSLVDAENTVIANDISSTIEQKTYNGLYPVIFTDSLNSEDDYSNNMEKEIIFDAGEGNNISFLINSFSFSQDLFAVSPLVNDRLAVLSSDLSGSDLTFSPLSIDWLLKTGLSIGDTSGNDQVGEYLNNGGGFVFPDSKLTALKIYYNDSSITSDASFNEIEIINTGKRYVKFRFFSDTNNVSSGWNIKVFKSSSQPLREIKSNLQFQEGNLGNPLNDFNIKFSFNSDYYLELDKSIVEDNPGILEFKDLVNTNIVLGFVKEKTFLLIKVNDIIWQFVITLPPDGYKFNYLDENGGILGELNPVANGNVFSKGFEILTYDKTIETTLNFSGTVLSFNETQESTSFDNNRKYKLYIRKSLPSEKIFLEKFNRTTLIQIEKNEITSRISDWYPLEYNYINSNNQLKYGVLYNTEEIEVEEKVVEEVEKKKDLCNLCKDITKTKEIKNSKLRYSNSVKINFKHAARLRGTFCE